LKPWGILLGEQDKSIHTKKIKTEMEPVIADHGIN
jgi:hypothetical protein